MKSILTLIALLTFASFSALAENSNCDIMEFDRVRIAATSSRECLAKYIGVTLAIGIGGTANTDYFQNQIYTQLESLDSDADLRNRSVSDIEKLGIKACDGLAYSSFVRTFCKDAARSFKMNPDMVQEVYCNAKTNVRFGLCR